MGGLILLRPWWLAGLAGLVLLVAAGLRGRPEAGGWQRVMPAPMLEAMIALGAIAGQPPGWHRGLAPLAMAALLLGLAGPALPRADAPLMARTDAAVIALDLSPSVAAGPGLGEAQMAAAALVQGLAGRPVGMILFAGEAFTVAAPTVDAAALESQIAVLAGDTMPGTGSRPAAALALASDLLAGLERADLVLISDGGGVDAAARAEADRLAAQGARISALQLAGLAAGAPTPPAAALDLLVRGGGMAMPADRAQALAARLDRVGGARRDPALVALQYRDLGPFLAALAALPLLVMLRRQR